MPECPTTFSFPGRKDTQVPECPSARLEMLDLKVGVPEGPSAGPLSFPGRKDPQVPECPSARLEMSDLRVGVPEGLSARPLFFFLEGMEMVGLRGGVPITAQIPECQTPSIPGGTI